MEEDEPIVIRQQVDALIRELSGKPLFRASSRLPIGQRPLRTEEVAAVIRAMRAGGPLQPLPKAPPSRYSMNIGLDRGRAAAIPDGVEQRLPGRGFQTPRLAIQDQLDGHCRA